MANESTNVLVEFCNCYQEEDTTLPDEEVIIEIREMWKLHNELPTGSNDTIIKNIYRFMVRYKLTYTD